MWFFWRDDVETRDRIRDSTVLREVSVYSIGGQWYTVRDTIHEMCLIRINNIIITSVPESENGSYLTSLR